MAFTKSVPDSQNPGIYTLAAVHRSSSPGFLFTTFHADTPDVERFAQAFPCRCSWFASRAHVSGQKLLTLQVIYHV